MIRKSARPGKKNSRARSALFIILGVALLLYPIVATLYNDAQLRKQAETYHEQVKKIDPPTERTRLLQEAREYNKQLAASGHHAYPPREDSPGYKDYLETLDSPLTGGVMARIKIDSIGVDLPIFHTSRPEVLYNGAGHMFGSDLPVGGMGTNAVITAHTGMVDASMFDQLPMLKDGEIVQIEVMGETLYYKVSGRKVVKPHYWEAVTYEPNREKITLITCTPYGINTDRLLVEADRVPGPIEGEGKTSPFNLSWWMIADLLIIVLVLLLILYLERRRRKRREARERARALARERARQEPGQDGSQVDNPLADE